MNTITRIQVEFGELAAPVPISMKHASATASRLSGVEVVVARTESGSFTEVAGSNGRSVEAARFIERIREVLRKGETQ